MFSLQPRDELVFGVPNSIINPQSDKILDDLIIEDHAFMESNTIDFTISPAAASSNEQQLVSQTGPPPQRQTRNRDVYGSSTRLLHRDIERKRRKEMSEHFASLRSLLPLELIKGKRSICDHMTEAANYINDMKKSIQELKARRDNLMKLPGKENGRSSDGGNNMPNLVTVNMAAGNGLEILISCTDFGLSKVLAELVDRDISVVNCISTKSKGRFLHKIQAEASDVLKSLDPVELQQRLRHLVV